MPQVVSYFHKLKLAQLSQIDNHGRLCPFSDVHDLDVGLFKGKNIHYPTVVGRLSLKYQVKSLKLRV